jgi:hypothetical protein
MLKGTPQLRKHPVHIVIRVVQDSLLPNERVSRNEFDKMSCETSVTFYFFNFGFINLILKVTFILMELGWY